MHSNRKVYQVRESTLKKEDQTRGPKLPVELKALLAEQAVLHKKIRDIENRLRFGYSEPLNDYRTELIREDIFLSAKIMDGLLALHK